VQDVLDPDNRMKRCDLLLALGGALMLAREPLRAADEVAEQAWRLAEALGERERQAAAGVLALQALYRYGTTRATELPIWGTWVERLTVAAAPGSVAAGWAAWGQGHRVFAVGRNEEAVEQYRAA